MRLLHILRSKPVELVTQLVREMSRGETSSEVLLYEGPLDYAKLVEEIFRADSVICWW
jgi:hypothetical protein